MIAIVGAGITGLALATALKRKGREFLLFEAAEQVGGNIQSVKKDQFLLEKGPNSLQLSDEIYSWLALNGLDTYLQPTAALAKNRYILKAGAYRKLPKGPVSFMLGSTFSAKAKKALWRERKQPPQSIPEESIDHFFRRRLGDELTDYLVYPFISGIYAGNPQALILAEAFPQLNTWEEEYGSLIKGMMKSRKKQAHKGTVSFQGGMQQMCLHLAEQLGEQLQLGQALKQVLPTEKGYELHFPQQTVQAEQVVLAMPAYRIAEVLGDTWAEGCQALNRVDYPPVTVVHTAYKREDIAHDLAGFGALHNKLEPSNGLGVLFSSTTFEGRTPEGDALLTTFVGGAMERERAHWSDEELLEKVGQDHERFLGVKSSPHFQSITRWAKAIPQYDREVGDAQAFAKEMETKGLWLAGNWNGGISMVACIKRGNALAEKL